MIGKTLVKMVSSSEDEFPGPVGLRCFSMEFSEESIGTNRGHPRLSQIPIGWLINRGGRPLQHLIQLIDDRWYTGPSIFFTKRTSCCAEAYLEKWNATALETELQHAGLPTKASDASRRGPTKRHGDYWGVTLSWRYPNSWMVYNHW